MGCDKDCSDCEQVVGEVVMVSFITTENHEFRASLVEDKLQQVGTNSRKPVSMHDHNFRDHSGEDAFQKGLQPPSLEVDPGGDVFKEDVFRGRFLQVFNLALKVCLHAAWRC